MKMFTISLLSSLRWDCSYCSEMWFETNEAHKLEQEVLIIVLFSFTFCLLFSLLFSLNLFEFNFICDANEFVKWNGNVSKRIWLFERTQNKLKKFVCANWIKFNCRSHCFSLLFWLFSRPTKVQPEMNYDNSVCGLALSRFMFGHIG